MGDEMSEITLSDEVIRAVFLRNGFTVKEGQSDLKHYVFAAARELLSVALNQPIHEEKQPDVPKGWHNEWGKNVMRLWDCARRYDSNIPDDQLDFMRDYLLNAVKGGE